LSDRCRRVRALLGLLLPLALLAGCATPGPAPGDRTAPALERFRVDGKVAWRHPQDNGRTAVEWTQDGERARLLVTGPFGTGAAVLRMDADGAELEAGDRRRSAANAETLLATELGMPLPVARARWWILGVPAPGFGAVTERDEDGRPRTLEQGGWRIRIERWTSVDGIALPVRMEMIRGELRVLFVATRWQPGVAEFPDAR
jgi:outer membrane lipoprotein LolB